MCECECVHTLHYPTSRFSWPLICVTSGHNTKTEKCDKHWTRSYGQCYGSASSPGHNTSISVWDGQRMTQTKSSNVFSLSDTTVGCSPPRGCCSTKGCLISARTRVSPLALIGLTRVWASLAQEPEVAAPKGGGPILSRDEISTMESISLWRWAEVPFIAT